MSKEILITGANGFIGTALVQALKNEDKKIKTLSSFEGDITEISTLKNINFEDISHVIHLAAKTFVPDSWQNPSDFYRCNFSGTLNLLEMCRINRIGMTFISGYVYGEPECIPIAETDRIIPSNPYAHSKYLAEQLCEFYSKNYDMTIKIIRPFNVYGKGQKESFLIPHIIKQAMNEESIRVMDLSPKRDYIYIDDLVNAIILTINDDSGFQIYNVGSGNSFSVQEIIDKVQRILGTDKRVVCSNKIRKNELNDVVADIKKVKQYLNWEPRYTIDEGIQKIIDGWCKNE